MCSHVLLYLYRLCTTHNSMQTYSYIRPIYLNVTNKRNHFQIWIILEKYYKLMDVPKTILRKKKATLLDHLYTVVNACGDHNALFASTQHIKAAVMLITAISSNPNHQVLPKKRMIAPNTNINKQTRFFKTKQTKLSKILQLPKPSNYEQRVSKQTLSEINTKFCAICFREDDTNISSDSVEWVQCVRCSMWIHSLCLHIDVKKDNHYICNYCCT